MFVAFTDSLTRNTNNWKENTGVMKALYKLFYGNEIVQ
jgi:hypothetical protein